ncbi:MAG: hypothetical protein ACYC5G_04415 [Candidatus Doudnabacteria bacterium]
MEANKIGKRIPISWGKKIAEDLGYTQVIVHGFDGNTGIQSVMTYGKTLDDCRNAANGGNEIKRLLGWPEDMCNTKPRRGKPKQ